MAITRHQHRYFVHHLIVCGCVKADLPLPMINFVEGELNHIPCLSIPAQRAVHLTVTSPPPPPTRASPQTQGHQRHRNERNNGDENRSRRKENEGRGEAAIDMSYLCPSFLHPYSSRASAVILAAIHLSTPGAQLSKSLTSPLQVQEDECWVYQDKRGGQTDSKRWIQGVEKFHVLHAMAGGTNE
jgi:hypothetical protein